MGQGLGVFFDDDIRRVLAALSFAVGSGEGQEYKRGYLAALFAVAVAFGVVPVELLISAGGEELRGKPVGGQQRASRLAEI